MIKIEHLSKTYGNLAVLKDVNKKRGSYLYNRTVRNGEKHFSPLSQFTGDALEWGHLY